MQPSQTALGMSVRLNTRFEAALVRTVAALKAEGFGVLTEIDVRDTLKKKLDVDFRPYQILGVCNPSLAHRALITVPDIGLWLPCNVTVVQMEEGQVQISIMDPLAMLHIIPDDTLKSLAQEARERLERVLTALEK